MRGEDVGDGAPAEGDRVLRFEGERCSEEPLTVAQNDRVDDQEVLVDEAGLHQRSGEPHAAVGQQVAVAALLFEPRDGFGKISGGDRRLAPAGGRELRSIGAT